MLDGALMLDDFDLRADLGDPAPARYGVSARLRFVPAPRLSAFAEYTQVSSFAYRTNRVVDRYHFLERGLGHNYADYDRLSAGVEWTPSIVGLLVAPALVLLRQGEGDPRVPFPAYDDFLRSPWLFLGVRETTVRAALRARYQPSPHFWMSLDAGPNAVRNARHQDGVSESALEGVIEVGVSLAFLGRSSP
jgi:hypothetical protein